MADLREKTISELKEGIKFAYHRCHCGLAVTMENALVLLKAQEPIEPIEFYDDTKCVKDYNRTLAWKCGKCGYYIGGADNFCANCGQAVKWDG